MPRAVRDSTDRSPKEIHSELRAQLLARRLEFEVAVLARIEALYPGAVDPRCSEDLRAAISAPLGYDLSAVEPGDGHSPPLPGALLAQARLAARRNVGLDVVLRCCFAGYSVLRDFLIEEAEAGGFLDGAGLADVLRTLVAPFGRTIVAIADEYRNESERHDPLLRSRLSPSRSAPPPAPPPDVKL
jgi:hypothetical protein